MSNPHVPAAYRENPTAYSAEVVRRVESGEVKACDLDTFDYFRFMDHMDTIPDEPEPYDSEAMDEDARCFGFRAW